MAPIDTVTFTPIGVVHTPFAEKASAPRQASLARDVRGVIELWPGRGFEDALTGVDAWDHLWVVYLFHENDGRWRPKVLPPRSRVKRGVFATRSPHRPNGIGLSAVRLERIVGLSIHVRGVDMLDGSPVLDLKPYVPYADAIPEASSGWLEDAADPAPRYGVEWSELATLQCTWLNDRGVGDVRAAAETILAAGPEPHAYRRIRRRADGTTWLAVKAWRLRFSVEQLRITVVELASGHRPRDWSAATEGELAVHRGFAAAFGGAR